MRRVVRSIRTSSEYEYQMSLSISTKSLSLLAGVIALALFGISCGDDGDSGDGARAQPTSSGGDVDITATIRTSQGDIEVDLFEDIARVYVDNFVRLAESNFYDGSLWHRVVDNFVIQGGRNVDGQSTPEFDDEFHPAMRHDSAGILSMANRGLNTNTSQFFITHLATPHLDPYENGEMKPCATPGVSCHAVFGRVTDGLDVIYEIRQGVDSIETIDIHR